MVRFRFAWILHDTHFVEIVSLARTALWQRSAVVCAPAVRDLPTLFENRGPLASFFQSTHPDAHPHPISPPLSATPAVFRAFTNPTKNLCCRAKPIKDPASHCGLVH